MVDSDKNPLAKLRQLRSFVRREGRMRENQKKAITLLWDQYGLEVSAGKLDLEKTFGRQAPCVFEIGFGMGQSLLEMAERNPQQDYVGVEVHRPGIGAILAGIESHTIKNIRIFRADALEVLEQCIPANSLATVQMFFPDPWPKKRHHKRRLLQPALVKLIHSKLQSQGNFHLATDWQDYAQYMLAVLSSAEGFINVAGVGNFSVRPATRPLTKFEQRGLRLGHEVWDLIFRKQ